MHVCRLVLGIKLILLFCPVTGGAGSLGHSRTGGLWPTKTSVLSRHRCDSDVFLYRQPRQFGWDFLFSIVSVFFLLGFGQCVCLHLLHVQHVHFMSVQRTFQRSGLLRSSTSVPVCLLFWWVTRKTCEMMSTHVESWLRWNRSAYIS